MSEFKVQSKPTMAQFQRDIKKRAKKVGNLLPVHKKISILLDQKVQSNFKKEGSLFGGWVPFAAGGRRKKGGGIDTSAKLLQDTGKMRASHSPFFDKRNAGIGSDVPYSVKHNKGIGVPKRRTLPEAKEVQSDVFKIYDSHVKRSIS